MPRKRRKRDKKPEKKSSPPPKTEVDADAILRGYSVDDMANFSKTGEDSYILIYRVPTGHLSDEEIMKHYRSKIGEYGVKWEPVK